MTNKTDRLKTGSLLMGYLSLVVLSATGLVIQGGWGMFFGLAIWSGIFIVLISRFLSKSPQTLKEHTAQMDVN